jgi:streptogramin lyase
MTRTAFRTLAVTAALLFAPLTGGPTIASAADPPVIARITVAANDNYDLAGGLGAVWLLNPDEFQYDTLRRIDPATNRITASYRLDSAAGGFAVGDDSIWVAMYFDNTLERLDGHGHVLARIGVGLQPQSVHLAFGSVWVSNHHGRSLSRINPRTDRVTATLPAGDQHMFRDGPQQIIDDGRFVYIYSSNGTQPFERIDPRTNAVVTFADRVNCGDMVAIAGSVWTTDCGGPFSPPQPPALNQLDPATGAVRHTITRVGIEACGALECPFQPTMTAHRGALWIGFDTAFDDQTGVGSGGTIQDLNPRTGAVEQQISIGGDVSVIRSADGDLWVLDDTSGVISRLHPDDDA